MLNKARRAGSLLQSVRFSSRFVLVGPPGGGKGTICNRLVNDFGIKVVGTGDLIRKEIASKSKVCGVWSACVYVCGVECGLCVVCVWSVCVLCVCGLCVVCVWSVCGLCAVCAPTHTLPSSSLALYPLLSCHLCSLVQRSRLLCSRASLFPMTLCSTFSRTS